MKTWICLFLLSFVLVGCGSLPLRPGRASFVNPNGVSGTVRQSQNPQQETIQHYERVQDGTKVTEKVETKIGAAQKDVAREIGAKLAGLRPVMYVGILLTLFGIASFHPALRMIVGSVTTSVIIIVAGIGMIVLPSLIVGNEVLILGVGVGAVVLYWFSHRHGKLQGFVDANKDGIDDRKQ